MNKEFIQKLTQIVEANMANEAFGTEDLARQMGMSHSNLHRKLKAISNQTISQFIRETRLKKARELILNENLTVAEIAYRVGFGSPTYFNKCFHEFFGYSPGELKKEEQWSEREIPVENTQQKRSQTRDFNILFISLIILVPVFVFLFDKTRNAANKEEKYLAILPFEYMSDDVGKQYLANAMMRDIHHQLSKIEKLTVISLTSVEQYRNTTKTISQIGKELNVAYLLEGSYQIEGENIRLILQLRKTKDEGLVWAEEYNKQRKDIFMVQNDVAQAIASELDAIITPEEHQLIRKSPTVNLTAYDYYQRGIEYLDNARDSVTLSKATTQFQKALKLDSTFSRAIAGLARISYIKFYKNTFLSKSYLDTVLILANKALKYDRQCAEAYYYKGVCYYQRARPKEALLEIDKSIKFNPNYSWAYYMRSHILSEGLADYVGALRDMHEAVMRNRGKDLPDLLRIMGWYLADDGFYDLSKQYFYQAFELDGDSTEYLLGVGTADYASENFELAYQTSKNIYKKDTNNINSLGLYATITGRYEESYKLNLKQMEVIKRTGQTDLWNSKGIGYYLWKKGKFKEARFYFDQHIRNNKESIQLGRWNAVQKGAQYDLAEVYAFIGEKEKAYQYLDEVLERHAFPRWWVILFKYTPLFENIRQEPRFQSILKEVESKYQAEHDEVGQWLAAQGML